MRRCLRIDADEDIPPIVTTTSPTTIQRAITRARARQVNYQLLSFLGTIPLIHENMILPKIDMFVTLRNNGPSQEEKDKHWSMMVHGDGSMIWGGPIFSLSTSMDGG